MKSLRRPANPAAFLASLLLFLFLPLVAVSCEADEEGSFDVSYSGSAVLRDQPSVEGSGTVFEMADPVREAMIDDFSIGIGVRILAALVVIALLAGAASTLLRTANGRRIAASALAFAGMIALFLTQNFAVRHLRADVRSVYEPLAGTYSDVPGEQADALTRVGPGYWTAAAVLIVVLAVNLIALGRQAQRRQTASG